ncbi:MAG TPA: lyase family protein [Candidatus Binataceae bacterium]|nr:lyase family protein [Candidatus Binataceae bacterium]
MAVARRRGARGTSTRIERDSIGTVAVPREALYGVHTWRALRNLAFSGRSLADYPGLLRALALVKLAAARANRAARVLDARRAHAIESACASIARGAYRDQFPADVLGGGGWIGINMNLNEVIAKLANRRLPGSQAVDPKAHVNASQSTADVCHTASRIAILTEWRELSAMLTACECAYCAKARQLRRVTTMARTCLQDALPASLGEFLGGHAAGIARRTAALDRAVTALRRVNLGGTVIGSGAGTSASYRGAVIARLREVTGMNLRRRANLYDAAQNIDDLGAVAAELGLLAELLIKLAQDLRLLASGPAGGFGEIILPAVQEGSSFFAGKINPVVPETLMLCCFEVLGCERAARLGLERGELNLNVFEPAAAANILDAMSMLRRALGSFRECVTGLEANLERCAELASRARGS